MDRWIQAYTSLAEAEAVDKPRAAFVKKMSASHEHERMPLEFVTGTNFPTCLGASGFVNCLSLAEATAGSHGREPGVGGTLSRTSPEGAADSSLSRILQTFYTPRKYTFRRDDLPGSAPLRRGTPFARARTVVKGPEA